MSVSVHLQSLRENSVSEYVTRFAFGGAITVVAGITAKHYGPVIAGLLLAFPAIFPCGATLLADHQKKKMMKIGRDGTIRGRCAAAVDADGTALGCLGLIAFASVVWKMLPTQNIVLTLFVATFTWLLVSIVSWVVRRKL